MCDSDPDVDPSETSVCSYEATTRLQHCALLLPDVLCEIFNHCRPPFLPHTESPYAWLRVATVCRLWHDVVMDTPYLWNELILHTARREELIYKVLQRSGQVPLFIAIDSTTNAQSLQYILDNLSRVQVLILRKLDPNHTHIVRNALAKFATPQLQYLNICLLDGEWIIPVAAVIQDHMKWSPRALVLGRLTIDSLQQITLPKTLRELRLQLGGNLPSRAKALLIEILRLLATLPLLEVIEFDRVCKRMRQEVDHSIHIRPELPNLRVLDICDTPTNIKAIIGAIIIPQTTAVILNTTVSSRANPNGSFELFVVTTLKLSPGPGRDTRFLAIHFLYANVLRLWMQQPTEAAGHWNQSALPRLTFISPLTNGPEDSPTQFEWLCSHMELGTLESLALHGDTARLHLPFYRWLTLLARCSAVRQLFLGVLAEGDVPLEEVENLPLPPHTPEGDATIPYLFPRLSHLDLVDAQLAATYPKLNQESNMVFVDHLQHVLSVRQRDGIALEELSLPPGLLSETLRDSAKQYVHNIIIKPITSGLSQLSIDVCTVATRPVLGVYHYV